jgi:hypothetical protein
VEIWRRIATSRSHEGGRPQPITTGTPCGAPVRVDRSFDRVPAGGRGPASGWRRIKREPDPSAAPATAEREGVRSGAATPTCAAMTALNVPGRELCARWVGAGPRHRRLGARVRPNAGGCHQPMHKRGAASGQGKKYSCAGTHGRAAAYSTAWCPRPLLLEWKQSVFCSLSNLTHFV